MTVLLKSCFLFWYFKLPIIVYNSRFIIFNVCDYYFFIHFTPWAIFYLKSQLLLFWPAHWWCTIQLSLLYPWYPLFYSLLQSSTIPLVGSNLSVRKDPAWLYFLLSPWLLTHSLSSFWDYVCAPFLSFSSKPWRTYCLPMTDSRRAYFALTMPGYVVIKSSSSPHGSDWTWRTHVVELRDILRGYATVLNTPYIWGHCQGFQLSHNWQLLWWGSPMTWQGILHTKIFKSSLLQVSRADMVFDNPILLVIPRQLFHGRLFSLGTLLSICSWLLPWTCCILQQSWQAGVTRQALPQCSVEASSVCSHALIIRLRLSFKKDSH